MCKAGVYHIISIHALREEGDQFHHGLAVHLNEFLSTPSARRATRDAEVWRADKEISIHALREEGDIPFPTLPAP